MISKILWICVICGLTDSQNNQYSNNQYYRQQPQQLQPNQPWQQGQQRQIGNQYNLPTQTNQGQSNQFYLGANHQQQQQQTGYNYNQYGQQQQYQSSGSSQKGILANPYRQRNGNFSNNNGANVYFKINGYSNPGMTMPGGKTCVCPSGSCTFLQNVPNPCLVALTAIMTSSDQNVQYIASDFVPYNGSTGTLGYGNWNNDNNIQMATKPQSIDIFVHNLGVVIDKSTGNLVYFNYLTKVDTFVIDLTNYSPAPSSSQTPQQVQQTYTGQDVQSTLDFTFYVQCQSGYLGPLCDLNCNNNSGDNTHVVCTSTITGQQSVCNYTSSNKTQVGNCQVCVNGVYNNTCADLANQYNLESNKVSKAFKVWTIVLGVLLGLAVLFIILLLVMYVILRRQSDRQTSSYQRQPNYNAGYNQRAPNSLTNPLISKNDEWPRTNPPTAMSRGAPITDMETTQGTVSDTHEAPRNGHSHYSPRREAEV